MGIENLDRHEQTEVLSTAEMITLFDTLKDTNEPVWKELYRAANNFGGPESIRNLLEYADEDMSKAQQKRVGELLKLFNRPSLTNAEDIKEKIDDFISQFELI